MVPGGADDVFVGAQAGTSSTTGQYDVYLGLFSGYYSTTANRNVFIGYNAGWLNTTGEIAAQSEQIENLTRQLQVQNASLQERLSRLEKLVQADTVAMKDVH